MRTGPTPTVKTRTGPTPIVKTRTGPNPVTRWTPSGASPLVEPASIEPAPPSDATDQASELATTGVVGVESQVEDTGHARRWIVIPASTAIAILAGFGLWGISSDDDRAAPAPPIATSVANPTITVEPIPVAPHSPPDRPAGNPPAPADRPPDEPPRQIPPKDGGAGALAQPSRQVARDATRRAPHKEVKQPAPPPAPAPFTREQLAQKYQQVQREYVRYKSKFGQRLEKEWGDVMTSIQYVPTDDAGRREVARRLDEFRGRMRE
jgi:hypothetical protein